jgi:hypothetical protein
MEIRNKKGQFTHGNPGKPKGAQNKIITRTRLGGLIENNWQKFETELKSLKGRAYVEAFTKLLPFHMPSYSAINFGLKNLGDDDLEYLLEKLKEQFNEQETGTN